MTLVELSSSPLASEIAKLTFVDEGFLSRIVQDPHRALLCRGNGHLYLARWYGPAKLALLFAKVVKSRRVNDRLHVDHLIVELALKLAADLPRGRLSQEMDMETLLASAAESFGTPITCHPDEPYSTLYIGPSASQPGPLPLPYIRLATEPNEYYLCGTNRPEEGYTEHVWAFTPDKYRTRCAKVVSEPETN